jgi:hypothetical protein
MSQAVADAFATQQYHFASGVSDEDGGPGGGPARPSAENRELQYKVELWDRTGSFVEQVLAVTTHNGIGYAAYYAAVRMYPDRHITLRGQRGVVSRSSAGGALDDTQ